MNARISWFGTAALIAALVSFGGGSPAHAEVVFGNLGSAGTGSLGGTNTDIVPVAAAEGDFSGIAQGFTTGSSNEFLTLQSVVLGLFAEANVPARTVSLFSNNAGFPGTELAVSSAVTVGTVGRYEFGFGNIPLAANTSYWIVPQPDVSWHTNASVTAPAAQNSSGYSYLGTAVKTFDSAGAWQSAGLNSYAVSINAVPEPSTYALAATALGLCGIAAARRRRAGC
jgi:hypothetical protein